MVKKLSSEPAFIKAIDTLNEWVGRIFAFLLVPLTLVVVFEVTCRKVFAAPNIWSLEITNMLYASHFLLVAAYTLLYGKHVSIDILYSRFSPRKRALFDLFTYITFFFIFVVIFIKEAIAYAHTSWVIMEVSDTAELPLQPIKTVIPVAFFLLLLQGISKFVKVIIILKGKGYEP